MSPKHQGIWAPAWRSLLVVWVTLRPKPTQPLKSFHRSRITQIESFKTQLVQGIQTLWAISLKGNLPAGGWGVQKRDFLFLFFFFLRHQSEHELRAVKSRRTGPRFYTTVYQEFPGSPLRKTASASLWDADPRLQPPSRKPVWNKSMTTAKNSNS